MAANFFDTPPLRYVGSKWKLADWIIAQFPPHTVYVEPFCGGASVFFRKHRSPVELLNDIDGEIINFFDVLRTRTDELVRAIELTPHARVEYERALQPVDGLDDLERARRFYIGVWQSFGGTLIYRSGWRLQRRDDQYSTITDTWRRMDGLMMAASRLKDAQIDNRPALEVIKDMDSPKTLFYVDPPYPFDSRAVGARRRYRFEMTNEDHQELLYELMLVSGPVVLSSYKNQLYDETLIDLGGWTAIEKSATTNGNTTATEYLYLSPRATALNDLPLFRGII